jgi:hypothetical protein
MTFACAGVGFASSVFSDQVGSRTVCTVSVSQLGGIRVVERSVAAPEIESFGVTPEMTNDERSLQMRERNRARRLSLDEAYDSDPVIAAFLKGS